MIGHDVPGERRRCATRFGENNVTRWCQLSALQGDQLGREPCRVDVAVYAGHALLVDVVASPEQADRFIDDARSVNGVWSVRSYIQVTEGV